MESVLPIYNAHTYFPLKNLGKKVHIIHGKILYLEAAFASDYHTLYFP